MTECVYLRELAPAMFECDQGHLHISVEEIVRREGWEDTPAQREEIADYLLGAMSALYPDLELILR